MNLTELQIECAKIDGKNIRYNKGSYWEYEREPNVWIHCEEPNYPTSYDAIIPLIQRQNTIVQLEISHILAQEFSRRFCYELLLATPEQLCIALVKACGQWSE